MNKSIWIPLAIAILAAPAMSACSATRTSESTGEYVDDAAITSKVKAALLEDSGLKSFVISVETFKNVVQLSGFINSGTLKAKAGAVAAGVVGVRSVQNNLVVK